MILIVQDTLTIIYTSHELIELPAPTRELVLFNSIRFAILIMTITNEFLTGSMVRAVKTPGSDSNSPAFIRHSWPRGLKIVIGQAAGNANTSSFSIL